MSEIFVITLVGVGLLMLVPVSYFAAKAKTVHKPVASIERLESIYNRMLDKGKDYYTIGEIKSWYSDDDDVIVEIVVGYMVTSRIITYDGGKYYV